MDSWTTPHDDLAVAALRALSAQQIETAQSGHPGMPLGVADVAFVLWTRFLRHAPDDPEWFARDRFILSAGHASALLYSLLHLSGYRVGLDDLARFRQYGSITPGHPERGTTPGVEMTTGPLGQGLGASVGVALGLKLVEARLRPLGFPPLGSRVFVLASDGDMMEGLSSEAGSLAAHLALDNLTVIYDSNRVTIDGPTGLTFSERVGDRFRAFGWHVQTVDGYDRPAIAHALEQAIATEGAPHLIIAQTTLAKHVPGGEGDHRLHGAPLGPTRLKGLLETIEWPNERFFTVPEEAYRPFAQWVEEVRKEYRSWHEALSIWLRDPSHARAWEELFSQPVPEDFEVLLADAGLGEPRPTRVHSSAVLAAVAGRLPWLLAGSADLTESNGIPVREMAPIAAPTYVGQRIHYGVREHAMAAVSNGLALVGTFRPVAATFLTFADYMRPAMRMAALMRLPVVYAFSHDSVFVGEDGPTHQPVEQLACLRALPGLVVLRPADGWEVASCWSYALRERSGPIAIVLSRQKTRALPREGTGLPPVHRGAYVLTDCPDPDAVLVATGSEVAVALEAKALAAQEGVALRVVSMPSMELFMRQPPAYRDGVIPPHLPTIALEAAVGFGWERIVGRDGLFIGVDRFGVSAPAGDLPKAFGLDPHSVSRRIIDWLPPRRT